MRFQKKQSLFYKIIKEIIMKLLDKLEMALSSRDLAAKLLECLEKGSSEGLDETHLASALSSDKLAKDIIEAAGSNLKHLDMDILAIALGSREIAEELVAIEKKAEKKAKKEEKKEEKKKEKKEESKKAKKEEKSSKKAKSKKK